jgi:lipopolysaccharide/colanic/teichoic acid biosynthesis glycosyltransferase
VSALGLLLLAPLLGVIAICIKLEDPTQPVFYRQKRAGRFGNHFRIHKFRTMRGNADKLGPTLTIGTDPRVTRVGTWLRRHKLDELPQLWDVLLGDMSLVGPRPEVPRYVAYYPPELRDVVLSVRPGITDVASIVFRDESALLGRSSNPEVTYLELVLPAKLRENAQYVRENSLRGDVVIIARTLVALVPRRRSAGFSRRHRDLNPRIPIRTEEIG